MAGRRYSAGRIFLDVVPSFRGVIRETEREVEKLRRDVADDNAKAAEADEKAQGKVRSRERVKAERKANDAVWALREDQWRRLSIAEKRNIARAERARDLARQREARKELEQQKRNIDAVAKANADAIKKAHRERLRHEEALRRAIDGTHARAGQQMWKDVLDADKQAHRERLRMAEEAEKAERERAQRAARRAEKDLRAAQQNLIEIRRKRRAEDLAAQKKFDRDWANLEKERLKQAKLQGGRFGQDMREGIMHALKDLGPDIKVDADTSPMERKIQAIRERLQTLQSKRIGIDIDGRSALRELRAIERQADRLDRRGIDISVRTNAKGVSAILREQITVMRAAGRSATDLGNRHKRAATDSRDAANAFRIFSWRILGIALAIPMVVPLIAALAGAIGSLIPVALGATAGLGVLIAGFTGIAPAVKALGDVQQNAAKDALQHGKTMRNASRAVRDAQQGLDRAHEDAARAAEDSARRVADARKNVTEATERAAERVASALQRQERAERDLRDAQRDSLRAQQDLVQARKDAEDQLRDMALRQAGGALAERQARLDLARAKAAYLSVKGSGAHTREEKEQALLDFERAELDLESTILDNQRLAEERAHADKVGVEGSDVVVRAKERVTDAIQREKDAEVGLADASKDVADARAEAAEMVADAQRALSDALRDQRRQQEDSARSIRDANERLADSQAAYQEALTQTGDIGSASMQKLQEAMDALGPEGRAFAEFLHGLREPLAQLRRDVQAGLLPGVQEFMEDMIRVYGPAFSAWATGMGVLLGDIFRQTSEVFQNPLMRAFFDSMERYAGVFTQQVSTIVLNLLQVVAGLSTAFAPFGVAFGDALVRITAGWASWAGSLADSEGFYKFMDYVSRIGPEVTAFFVALGAALINIGVGLAPYGEMLINWASAFFGWIAQADPKVVGAIAAALIGVVVAIQLAAGAMTLLSGASLFFSRNAAGGFASPLALIVLGVVALIGVVAILRANFEGFREVTDRVAESLRNLGKWLWEHREIVLKVATVVAGLFTAWRVGMAVLPVVINAFRVLRVVMLASFGWVGIAVLAIAALVAGFVHLWRTNETFRDTVIQIWGTVRDFILGVVAWFVDTAVPWLVGAAQAVWEGMKWAWDNIGRPIWDTLVAVGTWAMKIIVNDILPILGYAFKILWGVIQLVFMWVGRLFGEAINDWRGLLNGRLGDILRGAGAFFVDFWKNGIVPTFEGIGAVIAWFFDDVVKPVFRNVSKAIDTMVEAFRSGESLIRSIWAGISDGLAGPIEFSIRFINDKMIDPLNGLLREIGLEWKIPHLPDVKIPRYVPREKGLRSQSGRAGTSTVVGAFATGGVLPGYSPGVDNIRFTSPYGDLLLGGGEGIIRPEVVRAVSPEWVDAANAAAMNGGVDGVRRLLGAHRDGTSSIDFSKLPRIPRTDIHLPPAEPDRSGASLWKRFTDLVSVVTDPRRAISLVVDKLSAYMPGKDTFIGRWFVGAMKKLGNLIGSRAEDTVGANAQAVGSSNVNYGGAYGWNPNVSGKTWPSSWAMIKTVAPEAIMTSNYRPGAITASGIPSLHGLGRAVDIISPNMAETFMKIRGLRKWSQLFYSPMGNLQIGYRDAIVHRTHFDHIHAGFKDGTSGFDVGDFLGLSGGGERGLNLYDTGGILDHGDLGLNLSGQPEAVLTHDQWQAVRQAGEALRNGRTGNTYEATVIARTDADPHEIADEWSWEAKRLERRHAARPDLVG